MRKRQPTLLESLDVDHFAIHELVPPQIFKQWGDQSIMFLDMRIVRCADLFRKLAGQPVTVNNWHRNGHYSESGFRLPNTKTGGELSQHKAGRALDLKVSGMSSVEMCNIILDNEPKFIELGLTTIENPIYTKGKFQDWLHIDCRTSTLPFINYVNP